MYLTEKSKQNISESIGIPYEELINKDDDEIKALVERKIGKKLKWKENAKIDGLPIMTMSKVNKKIDKMTRNER